MILTKCIVEEEDHDRSSSEDSINEEEKELEKIIKINQKSKKTNNFHISFLK